MDANLIDAGAKALREHDMAGRITRAWENLPESSKRKWVDRAMVVLGAADTTQQET